MRDDTRTTDPPAAATPLASRAGVEPAFVDELIALGVFEPAAREATSDGLVRRARLLDALVRGGIALPALAEALGSGALSLDFLDQLAYSRFSAYEDESFAGLAERAGVPVDLLLATREAMGSPRPGPSDHVRSMELDVLPFIQSALRAQVRPELIERTIRVMGDGARRVAETEADWWRSEILVPMFAAGLSAQEIGRRTETFASEISPLTDEAILTLYHGQQAQAWLRNIFDGFEGTLVRAGLHTRLDRVPAICFIDVTGYTSLTEQHGDAPAAEIAALMARVVQRESADHGGRTIKWLGDGVMLFFPEPVGAVLAALDMMDAIERQGLPMGHAGIHAGPVLFQEGDYFGRTVNAAARISGHARRGQVLVSEEVVDAVTAAGIAFDALGPVALKGMAPLSLFVARRARVPATPVREDR
jgi:class 3 adenylate cyclase